MTPFALVSGDFVTTGGMDRANYALAAHLARRGGPVHLVAHRVAPDLAALPAVRVHHVPKVAGSYLAGGPLLDRWGRRWGRRVSRAGGRVVVNAGNCAFGDVSWVHYVHAAYEPKRIAARIRRFVNALKHRVFLRNERRCLRQARLVIANSERTRADLINRLGLDPSRVRVVYYGSDPDRFRPADPGERAALRRRLGLPARRSLVAFVGALGDHRKGFDTLFEAWRRLCTAPHWDAELVVVGTGAELPGWQARAAATGMADRVRFLGFRCDVPDLLRACDALAAPTRYEAYGLGVHEALCCGLPALVSASAGVAERYPPRLRDWLLPDPEDVDRIVERLRQWQRDPSMDRDALKALSASLRDYTWDHMAAAVLSLITTGPA
jgi:glycosyltransferase involved in cell wall biosynthesis